MVKNLNTSLPVLYLKECICENCNNKDTCEVDDRLQHLKITVITDSKDENLLYGGYVCTGNKHQNVPNDKSEFLGERYFTDEDLSKIFDLKRWEEL